MRLLTFTLNEIQLREVKAALAKLDAGHRARVAWFDDHSLDGNVLSIHALDFVTVLGHCRREPENEMELFRLRKAAMGKLATRVRRTQDPIKKQNIEMWLEAYGKLWLGTNSDVNLCTPPPHLGRIEPLV